MKWPIFFLIASSLAAQEMSYFDDPSSQLFRDLEMVGKIDKQIHDSLPLVVNYQLQGGYFTMPSARTFDAGMFGFGFAYVPPYHIWSLGFQFFDHLETTGNYWVYRGILDSGFGHLGFGDSADRAANVKFILLRKEDGILFLPDFALGWNDFLGSCRFNSFYAVATKEFLRYNFEATLGWGSGRIQGFFGGFAWTPFRNWDRFWKNLTLVAEYDANNYKRHVSEHGGGGGLSRTGSMRAFSSSSGMFSVSPLVPCAAPIGPIALPWSTISVPRKDFSPRSMTHAPILPPLTRNPSVFYAVAKSSLKNLLMRLRNRDSTYIVSISSQAAREKILFG